MSSYNFATHSPNLVTGACSSSGCRTATKYAVPLMTKHGGGVIVNTASNLASVGLKDRAAYVASKGAVAALTRSMALRSRSR